VWLRDPIHLLQESKSDVVFMDDGARTPRFSPFFVNSGFYFQLYNRRTLYLMELMLKSVSEISSTHSHQATLTRHITEAHRISGLTLSVLDMRQFPSGIMYHHDKAYVKQVLSYEEQPYVWHMCWTSSREDKVKYFKEMGMWFLNDKYTECIDGKDMVKFIESREALSKSVIKARCCVRGAYWALRTNKTRRKE
jgi:hypothetical protein